MNLQEIAYYVGWGLLAVIAIFTLYLVVFLIQHSMYKPEGSGIPKLQELQTETTGIKNEIMFDDSIDDIKRIKFDDSLNNNSPLPKRSEIRPDKAPKKSFFED